MAHHFHITTHIFKTTSESTLAVRSEEGMKCRVKTKKEESNQNPQSKKSSKNKRINLFLSHFNVFITDTHRDHRHIHLKTR